VQWDTEGETPPAERVNMQGEASGEARAESRGGARGLWSSLLPRRITWARRGAGTEQRGLVCSGRRMQAGCRRAGAAVAGQASYEGA
jgi:hypothetical protein